VILLFNQESPAFKVFNDNLDKTRLVVITTKAVKILDVPSLNIASETLYKDIGNISHKQLSEAFISDHGIIGLWTSEHSLQMYSLHPGESIPQFQSKIFDQSKVKKTKTIRNPNADELCNS
jgi:hypothetical protein